MVTNNLIHLFPEELREIFQITADRQAYVQEIRLRAEKPIYVLENGRERFLDKQGKYTQIKKYARIISATELTRLVNHICKYSLYAYEEELKQGFLTVPGGHRIGMAGRIVVNDGENIKTMKYFNAVNIRVAHQIKGAADPVIPHIYQGGILQNTIIVSPPGCGKTTLLRDIIRQVSDGNSFGSGMNIGVVDERSEIAACFQGCPQNDVGMRTDVLERCPKVKGMLLLIRSMSPKVVAIDEVGDVQEWKTLQYASYCGISLLATMHGDGLEDYKRRSGICLAEQTDIFSVCIVTKRYGDTCVVDRIYKRNKEGVWNCLSQGL